MLKAPMTPAQAAAYRKTALRLETDRFRRYVGTKLMPRFDGATADGLKLTMLELMSRVLRIWPVDRGRSRAAWMLPAEAYGLPVSARPAPNYDSAAVQLGRSESRYTENLIGPRKSLVVDNGTPYAIYLEFGHSRQAPQGGLRVSMREMRGKAVRYIRKTARTKI